MASYTLLNVRKPRFEPLSVVFVNGEKAYKESLVSFCGVAEGGECLPARQPHFMS